MQSAANMTASKEVAECKSHIVLYDHFRTLRLLQRWRMLIRGPWWGQEDKHEALDAMTTTPRPSALAGWAGSVKLHPLSEAIGEAFDGSADHQRG